jgi:hypothetical protein
MLASQQLDEAYKAIAAQLEFDVLGVAPEVSIAELREDPGTLADQRWSQLEWQMPEKETDPCWWLTNTKDEPSKRPSFLCRSLACMTLELNQNRVASTTKLRQAYENRAEQNAKVVDLLTENTAMWSHVHGIAPERLFRPRAADIELAKQACNRLCQLADSDPRDGLAEFAQEATRAIGLLASLEWEDIRIERFNLTPPAVFSELVRNAEHLLYRQAAEAQRL